MAGEVAGAVDRGSAMAGSLELHIQGAMSHGWPSQRHRERERERKRRQTRPTVKRGRTKRPARRSAAAPWPASLVHTNKALEATNLSGKTWGERRSW